MSISEQNFHLRDCFKVITQRRQIVLIFFAVTVVLVLLGTLIATPRYEGTTKVLIEKGESGELSGRNRGASYDAEFYQTQYQLIKSRAVARRVVDILELKEDSASSPAEPRASGGIKAWIVRAVLAVKSRFGGETEVNSAVQVEAWKDRMAERISEGIKVAPVAESHLVTISYTAANPSFAALVANTTAKAFIEETLNMKIGASRHNQGWMTKKAQVERENIAKAEQALQAYVQANGIVTLDNRITITPEKLSELSTQLTRSETRRLEVEALNAQVQRLATNPRTAETVTAIASDPTLRILRAQIVETEKQVLELSNKFGPKHPVMIKTNSDLDILQKKQQQEIRRVAQTIKNDYDLALANERNLRAQLELAKSETLQLNERFIRYSALKRDVDSIRQTYDALMLKLREQGITGETQPVNLWIVEEAAVPLTPSSPRKGLNLLLGLILGLLGGIGLAFFLDYLDNRIMDPDQIEYALNSPVLGVIPLYPGNARHIEKIVLRQPLSAFSENYKNLRSALLPAPHEAPARKILITSAVVGEGKTTTAVNLAIALAQTDKRVVLLDGDLRKPRIHKVFDLNNDLGLSSYLAGANGNEILQAGPLANLSIITAGPTPPNPSELISSQRLETLLDLLGSRYDFIVCDSPPVLMVADAAVLGRHFDGTVLVSKAHHTTHDMASRAVKTLRHRSLRILGLVVNGMDPRHNMYYYGEYHAASDADRMLPARAVLVGTVSAKGE